MKAEVPAAVQWLLIAGEELYRLVDDADQTNVIPQSDLYSENSPGLQKERWDLWKERLSWVQSQERLNDETKTLANQAYERMSDLEDKIKKP